MISLSDRNRLITSTVSGFNPQIARDVVEQERFIRIKNTCLPVSSVMHVALVPVLCCVAALSCLIHSIFSKPLPQFSFTGLAVYSHMLGWRELQPCESLTKLKYSLGCSLATFKTAYSLTAYKLSCITVLCFDQQRGRGHCWI